MRSRPHTDEKAEKAIQQQASKPTGPLVISVSIDQQKVRVFDANGLFAESPVSTGMRGHSTPMGVFSVIQKHKWHRSNIYSGAPMPYMQRITWSGVAMHAGVLPGYPASHGCIRMPNAFAIKMWGWTRMGARVIVAPGETAPENFSHPLLITKRLVPSEPLASDQPKPVTSSKSDKAAALEGGATLDAGELRASLALDDRDATTPAELRAKVRTAEAGAATAGVATSLASSTTTDAPASASTSADIKPDDKPQESVTPDAKPTETDRDSTGAVTAEASKSESAPPPATEAAKAVDAKALDAKAAEPKASETKSAESKSADAKPAEAKPAEAKPAEAKSEAAPAAPTPTTDAAAADKDQSRAGAEAAKPPLPAVDPKVQIAAFVSGKDRKLYVRQNMKPLFDVPVTIAASDRPLGTHVFTAEVDKDGQVRWTAATLPSSRRAEPAEAPKSRRHKALAEEPKPNLAVDTPAHALDRLSIPPEAMTRLAQAISTGGSLIVSDQAIAAGETGEGTDFIIRLR